MTTTLILLILPKMMMKMMSRKRIFTPGRPWSARRASGDTLSIPLLLLHPASSSPSAVHIISHITVHIMNVNAMFKKWKKLTFSPLVDFRISQVFLEVLTYLKHTQSERYYNIIHCPGQTTFATFFISELYRILCFI